MTQKKIEDYFNIGATKNASAAATASAAGDTYELYFDGACVPNPGVGGAGAVIYKNSQEIWGNSRFVGTNETNNTAEYDGLIYGLEEAIRQNIPSIIVKGDSQLVIKQMRGEYKVKASNLKQLYRTAIKLAKQITVKEYVHVYRNDNERADELSNEGLLKKKN